MTYIKDNESFCNFITMISVVSQGGANHHYKTPTMGSMLGIPCIYVYDVFILKNGKPNMKALKSYIEEPDIERVMALKTEADPRCQEKFNELLENYGISMWTVGKIEDVVELSCDTKPLQDEMKSCKSWKLSHVDNDTVEKISE